MIIEALINFYDLENNKQLRKKGEQFEVTEKRGKYLVSTRAVREVLTTEKQNNKLVK